LKRLLDWQITKNKFIGKCRDGSVTHENIIARMSGDMNTATGNVLIMCALVYCYMISIGMDICDYALCNNGDDVVLIFEEGALDQVTSNLCSWFLKLGFRMVVEEPVRVLEHIDFCQMSPIYDGVRWRLVRNFKQSLAKDRLSLKQLDNEKVFKKWISTVGEGGLALTSGIPIMQNVYRSWIVSDKRVKGDMAMKTGFFHLARGVKNNGYVQPSDDARVSFWKAFGVTPDHQRDLEKMFDQCTPSYDGVIDNVCYELDF
jgi:hypothetical protein